MEQFYYELESFTRANKYVYLLGDLDTRTYALSDIKITDDEMLRHIGVISQLVFMSDSIYMMNRLNIDTIRCSADSGVNSFGMQLIDFCKKNDMLILNGRALTIKV